MPTTCRLEGVNEVVDWTLWRPISEEPTKAPSLKNGSCPGELHGYADWLKFESHCYLRVLDHKSWYEARLHCAKYGSSVKLVSIHSENENRFVHENMPKAISYSTAGWIGLYRHTKGNVSDLLHYQMSPEPLFTKQMYVLSQDLVKSRSREIRVKTFQIVPKFDKHLGSSAAEVPAKFQNNTIIITLIARLRDFKRYGGKPNKGLEYSTNKTFMFGYACRGYNPFSINLSRPMYRKLFLITSHASYVSLDISCELNIRTNRLAQWNHTCVLFNDIV